MNYNMTAEAAAARLGYLVLRPTDYQLFVDIDTAEQQEVFERTLDIFKQFRIVLAVSITPSVSGMPHQHIVINLQHAVTATERVMFELALGSDVIRGVLGLLAIHEGRPHDASVFFELPQPASQS